MLNLLRPLLVLALLGVPLLVVTGLPRLFELAGSVPSVSDRQVDPTATPGFSLIPPNPTSARARFGTLDETPPPTLAPPAAVVRPVATAQPTATGERITIGNTGGQGAILRSDPVTGRPVGALHETQVLDVLERQTVPGSGEWVRVRTAEGVEGWVIGLVARPVAPANH